jgi:hypothetical protein
MLCTGVWERLVPSYDEMQNMNNKGVTENAVYSVLSSEDPYKHTQNFHRDWYSAVTGVEDFA